MSVVAFIYHYLFFKYAFSNIFARCVGFIMAKMVLRDLMDPNMFARFKAFLSKVMPSSISCFCFDFLISN